ncbi:hypothetical protein DV736_g3290, partial [Chaetothyriales sp. CBS 134916]
MKPPRALNAAILVTVSPAPPSTIYSAKILQQLQSFATTITTPNAPRTSQTYRAVFESCDAAARAVDASPLTIDAFHDMPSARTLDPFNVFGWQQRKRPHQHTFTCDLAVANDGLDPLPDNHSARLLRTHEHSSSLRHSLVDTHAPLNLVDGLSTRVHTVTNKGNTERQSTAADNGDQLPPVRKYLMGPRLRKIWSESSADT